MDKWREVIKEWMASRSRLGSSAEELASEWRTISENRTGFREKWGRHYAELLDLDQLFIAV